MIPVLGALSPRSHPQGAVRVLVLLLAASVISPSATAGASASPGPITMLARSPECWVPPVAEPVVDPFRAPACRWCPGNRGLKYGTVPGVPVRAVAAGIVSYSGRVAGTGYVVIRHADGLRATYGGLTEPFRAQGSFVPGGAVVGITEQRLHFGLRDGDEYLDPTPRIGRLVLRARLVPLDATPPRPGRVRLVCPRVGRASVLRPALRRRRAGGDPGPARPVAPALAPVTGASGRETGAVGPSSR